jgi:hypothetical protein
VNGVSALDDISFSQVSERTNVQSAPDPNIWCGAEARIAVGWVIVGGLGFASAFTLFLTPISYRWIAVWGATPGAAAHRLRAEIAGDLGA